MSDANPLALIIDKLEPEAASIVTLPGTSAEVVALASIAISLKRLADQFCPVPEVDVEVAPPAPIAISFDEIDPDCKGDHSSGKPCYDCWIPF
jgi:hypothetical protein